MNEPILRLRKLDFPDNVRGALSEMAHCITRAAGAHIPGLGNDPLELAKDIMLQFIFYGETTKLNPLYELQILEVMCHYAESEADENNLSSVFNFIFSEGDPLRQELLHKLISMGVGIQSKRLLDWASSWMQMSDCTSKSCLSLIQSVVQDYCALVPTATSLLVNLPVVSRSFTSCFLTAVSHIYDTGIRGGLGSSSKVQRRPMFPVSLLRIITDWIHSDSNLCLGSLQNSVGSPSQPQTCILGLMQYCILMPCLHNEDIDKDTELLHSQLHLGLLQTLLQLKGSSREVITRGDVQEVVAVLTKVQQNLPYSVNSNTFRMVVNRLAQFLQVAMDTGALRTNKDELQSLCKPIKPTRLLQIVLGIQTYQEPMEH